MVLCPKALCLSTIVAATLGLSLLAGPAAAQTGTRIVTRDGHTVIVSRDESGRQRTRVVVQKRSFLDGGTEVAPGERGYTNYVTGPTSLTPFSSIDNTAFSHRGPLAGPFDLPGRNNIGQW